MVDNLLSRLGVNAHTATTGNHVINSPIDGSRIGADGGRSTVRKKLGVELLGLTHARKWVVVDVANDTLDAPYTALHADSGVPVPGFLEPSLRATGSVGHPGLRHCLLR